VIFRTVVQQLTRFQLT